MVKGLCSVQTSCARAICECGNGSMHVVEDIQSEGLYECIWFRSLSVQRI